MKKTLIMAVCLLALASCGKGGNGKQADSDSIATVEPVAVETDSTSVAVYITKDSIGGVKIGMPVREVPDSMPGLYTRKENGASPDAVTMVFADGDKESFIAYDFGEGKVDVLNLIGNGIKVNAPRGAFGLGESFGKVLELPGVKAEWAGYDDTGMWYWTWEGLWFAPSQENLPDMLSRRLYHSTAAPTIADFTDDVTVGFIGTGLPF